MSKHKKILLCIDSNALIHRAYHAFPNTLTTKEGELVNAVYGFCSLTLQIIEKFKPDFIVFAFDSKGDTFRHKVFSEYKANRKKMDDELRVQFDRIKEFVNTLGLPLIELESFEADDIIGTITSGEDYKDIHKIIVTGDKDLMQLLNDNTDIFLSGSNFSKSVLFDEHSSKQKLGIDPKFLIDYKGLRGDPSDNIPGVRGVGDKSAIDLINEFGDLDSIYSHLDKVHSRYKSKLEEGRKLAFLSKDLATIKTDVPIIFDLNSAATEDINFSNVREFFTRLEFRSLLTKLPKFDHEQKNDPKINASEQVGLFDANHEKRNIVKIQEEMNNVHEISSFVLSELSSPSRMGVLLVGNYCTFLFDDGLQLLSNLENDIDSTNKLLDRLSGSGFIGYDTKFIKHKLSLMLGRNLEFGFDLMIASHLTSGGKRKNDFSTLLFDYTGEILNEEDFNRKGLDPKLFWSVYESLKSELDSQAQLNKLYEEIEMPLIDVLYTMENEGVTLDIEYMRDLEISLEDDIEKLKAKIFDQSGIEFNISSPKQLGDVLFDRLQLPGARKSKSGAYSTNEKVLRPLQNDFPIVTDVLSFRELTKMRSTYTSALIDAVDKKTGKIHTTYHQVGAATGRFSSSSPNLQNIPISSEVGQKIRRAFIPSNNYMFVMVDYSQQELRLLASLSKEPKLIDAFTKGIDIHALTASQLFSKDVSDITKNERRIGKTVNFGVIYGISGYGLSEGLGIERKEAQSFIDAFYESYPKVREFFDDYLEEAKQNGFAETLYGRRRDASGLSARNFQIRSATEREIVNFPIQGAAADMMKAAMNRVYAKVRSDYPDFARLILQIHDELVFEVATTDPDDIKLKKFVSEVKKEMLMQKSLSVPMDVDVEYGFNLADKKNF